MKNVPAYIVACACLLYLSGCGRSRTENNSEENPPPAGNSAKGKAFVKIPAVDFHTLQKFLPVINGYKRSPPDGASVPLDGETYTEASADYSCGDSTVRVTIDDYAGIPGMIEPYKEKITFQNDEGYSKQMEWNGFTGWESLDKTETTVDAGAIVDNRIVVIVEGNGQHDASLMESVMRSIELSHLEMEISIE